MKPDLTTEQRDLIERTLQAIAADPAHFDMNDWKRRDPCGTVCCFAGHLVRQAGLEPAAAYQEVVTRDGRQIHIGYAAGELLGFPRDKEDLLFLVTFWPDELWKAYSHASTAQRPAILRKRIEHWMETGE